MVFDINLSPIINFIDFKKFQVKINKSPSLKQSIVNYSEDYFSNGSLFFIWFL